MSLHAMNAALAIIIATKNRHEAIGKYALASLGRSEFRDFLCVVWDASDDDRTRKVVECGGWGFPVEYHRAPRAGSSSQRNDAAAYVLNQYPSARYLLFIDDDSEVSPDAPGGVAQSFRDDPSAWGVNLPFSRPAGSQIMSPCLHNYAIPGGDRVDWLVGCGMAFRREVFDTLRFPEAFQRFGSYALGEDMALSFYLKKKLGKKLIHSCSGTLRHHAAPGGRPNIAGMAAAKWYNFHLLFEAVYDAPRPLWLRTRFKLFMAAAALKCLFRARSLDLPSVLRGVAEARRALREYHQTGDVGNLMKGEPAPAFWTESRA